MHKISMHVITLALFFINTLSDQVKDHRNRADEISSNVKLDRRSAIEDSLSSHPPETYVYQNMRGVEVKVKNVRPPRGKKLNQNLESSASGKSPVSLLKSSESTTTFTPVQPVYLPMETLPGLDLEIDAMGLGGIPPGVRIETRNGRPVVEILPNLDLMHSMANEEDKQSTLTEVEAGNEMGIPKKKRRIKKTKRRIIPKDPETKQLLKNMEKSEESEEENETDGEEVDDGGRGDQGDPSKRPGERPSIRVAKVFRYAPEANEYTNSSNEYRMRKRGPEVDVEYLSKTQAKDEGKEEEYSATPHTPRDLSDPRITHAGRRVNRPLWNYEEEDKWSRRYPQCSGSSQSPINLTPKLIQEETGLNLDFTSRYNFKLQRAKLINTGLTLEVQFDGSDSRPGITGSGVYDDMYLFEKMHFHWGSKNTIGSEHSIFGQKFPVELHFVHYNDKYRSLEDAFDKPDGLCVVAVFFQVGTADNPRFNRLLSQLSRVECGGQVTPINDQITLSHFLPSNRKEFYRYQGSLTTPPCSESVTWIILKHGLLISKNQLKKLRELKQHNCQTPITNNWRNIQQSHGRRIEKAVQQVSFNVFPFTALAQQELTSTALETLNMLLNHLHWPVT